MPISLSNRASILAFLSVGKTATEVAELLQIPVRTVRSIFARAVKRGFEPNHRPLEILDSFILDAPRTGRPRKQTDEVKEEPVSEVRVDRFDRENTYTDFAGELSSEGILISAAIV